MPLRRPALVLILFATACRSEPKGETHDGGSEVHVATAETPGVLAESLDSVGPLATAAEPTANVAPAPTEPAEPAKVEPWNDAQIAWQSPDAAFARAKTEHKPLCLVFYTTWCPHCSNYSHVFEDPSVVARARDFVMVRVDADQNAALSAKYSPDGSYVPRTYFLASNGTLDPEVHAPRDQFRYFYDERDPTSILGGMEQALRRFKR